MCSKERPADAVKTAYVERCELLEGRRGEVDAADVTARTSIRNCDCDGLAVGAGDLHLAAAHRVARREGQRGSNG